MAHNGNSLRLDGPVARRLNVTLTGTGPDLVVFAHGLGTDQTVWQSLLRTLPANYCALRFDQPGVGPRSPDQFDPASFRSLAPLADDLLALLEELDLYDVTLVGHSISGMVAALAAIEAPDRFGRLVMINSSPCYLEQPGYAGGFTDEALAQHFHAMATDYQAWVAGFAGTVIPPEAPDAVADFAGSLSAMRPDIAIAVARIIFAIDLRPLLAAMKVPTILIHSRNDPAVPPAVGTYLQAHLPSSQLVWINAAGHLPHLSAPTEVAALLWASLA